MISIICDRNERDSRLVVAIFGVGLIGRAVARELRRRLAASIGSAATHEENIPISWQDSAERGSNFARIEESLRLGFGTRTSGEPGGSSSKMGRWPTLRLVWSAGKAGFLATEEETRCELDSFKELLVLAERIRAREARLRLEFFLISSAGGIFEGQRLVDVRSRPAPMRPYGRLKQRQEESLEAATCFDAKRVYRLTSVYGPFQAGLRRGLVATLLFNGLRGQVTAISGRMSTLRDFVWLGDVARHLAGTLASSENTSGEWRLETLGSGRPTSVLEVQKMVEDALGRRLYVSCSLEPQNPSDITFSTAVFPDGWRPTDLRSNLFTMYRLALAAGLS